MKPTNYYVAVLASLYRNKNHPPADDIFWELVPSIPGLSRTSVYTFLDMLYRAGAIQVIHLGKYETLDDGDTSRHGHFICEKCGCVHDMTLNCEQPMANLPQGATMYNVSVVATGECQKCNERAKKERIKQT